MNHDVIVHQQPTHCLNCGAAVQASYCQHCGQETHAHVPGVGEYLHEFVGHYIALESKLWKTLVLLLFRPGRLTREYIEGKRVRYVLPLRLYLTFSLVFFALFKWQAHEVPVEKPKAVVEAAEKADAAERARERQQARADIAEARKNAGAVGAAAFKRAETAIDEAERADADGGEHKDSVKLVKLDGTSRDKLAGTVGATLAAKLAKLADLSFEEQLKAGEAAFFSYAPYAIFAMMPVFALYLKLMYFRTGRRYGEHLLFALHTNAFAFLMLTLMLALPSGIPYLRPALALWLAFYLPTAMRKVYGGSRLATGVRWIVLMAFHLLGMLLAVVAATLLTVHV